jgi:MFS family permease
LTIFTTHSWADFFDSSTKCKNILLLAQAHYGVELSDSNIRAIYTAIVSMFVVGGMVGAMGGGYVADRLGRRRGLIFAQVSGGLRYPDLFINLIKD